MSSNPITRRRAKTKLEQVMYAWLSTMTNEDGWTDIFPCVLGEETTELMAEAAWTVLEAVDEAQRHAVKEGLLKP